MQPSLPRRRLLGGALAAAGLAALPRLPLRAQPAALVSELREGVFVIDAAGHNVVACRTDAGLVLVDSGPAGASEALLAALRTVQDDAVHTLFNTHWHAEQVGSNAALGLMGTRIVGSAKTWQHLSTRYYVAPEQRYHVPLPEAARPTEKLQVDGSRRIGGLTFDHGLLVQPHTDGDMFVWLREANLLVAGGAVASDRDPELDWYGGGWLGGRADSLKRLAKLTDAETLIVPATGKVMTQAELLLERDRTDTLYQRLRELIRKGCSADCMQQEGALEGLGHTWQDPQRFLYAAYKGLWAHHYNLSADLL